MAHSFYGNLAAPSFVGTPLYFDAIYSNKYMLKCNEKRDNIFLGRYVLISYAKDPLQDLKQKIEGTDYSQEEGNLLYSESSSNIEIYLIKNGSPTLIYSYDKVTMPLTKEQEKEQAYTLINYNIDKYFYGLNEDQTSGRDYDSTVWQKAFMPNIDKTNTQEQYIKVAKLNTEVPIEALELIYGSNYSAIGKTTINPAKTVDISLNGYDLFKAYPSQNNPAEYYFLSPNYNENKVLENYSWKLLFSKSSSIISNAITANQIVSGAINQRYIRHNDISSEFVFIEPSINT